MEHQELLNLLQKSKKVVITSHTSPDPDAIGSSLYLYNILKRELKAEVSVAMEGVLSKSYSFLQGFDEIINGRLVDTLSKISPDTLVMLDGNSYKRFVKTEDDALKLKKLIENSSIKTIIIDHHSDEDKDPSDIYINNKCSSASEEVYSIFTGEFGFKATKPDMENVLFGILGDTGRFLYKNPAHRKTFAIVSDIIDVGVSIEVLSNSMDLLTPTHLRIMSELTGNFKQKDDYNFSFISDTFAQELISEGVGEDVYSGAYHAFMHEYIRIIEPNKWGFVVVPDIGRSTDFLSTDAATVKIYKGSFRAVNDLLDTTVFTRELGGGGHKPASGCKFKAESCEMALKIVHDVIAAKRVEAYGSK